MEDILITEADLDLAHAIENTINTHALTEAIYWYKRPVIIATPNGFHAIGSISYEAGFIVLNVLE